MVNVPHRLGVTDKPLMEKLKLACVFGLLALLIYLSRPRMPDFAIGVVLVTLGTLVRVWAAGHLTRNQQLTTSGPYQYSRNPFYLGRLLLIVGFALMGGVRHPVVQFLFVVALLIFFFVYMPRKEQREGDRLRALFGEEYDRWKANVPSLFPRLTPYRMHPRPWNRELYLSGNEQFGGNKEIWTTLVIILLVGLFYWRLLTLADTAR